MLTNPFRRAGSYVQPANANRPRQIRSAFPCGRKLERRLVMSGKLERSGNRLFAVAVWPTFMRKAREARRLLQPGRAALRIKTKDAAAAPADAESRRVRW